MKRTEIKNLHVGQIVKLTPQGSDYQIIALGDLTATLKNLANGASNRKITIATSVYCDSWNEPIPGRLPRAPQDHPGTRAMWGAPEPMNRYQAEAKLREMENARKSI